MKMTIGTPGTAEDAIRWMRAQIATRPFEIPQPPRDDTRPTSQQPRPAKPN